MCLPVERQNELKQIRGEKQLNELVCGNETPTLPLSEIREMRSRNLFFSPVLIKKLNERVMCISYPTGNTSRHMGQLCRPPPTPLTPLCTSSFSSSSLLVPLSCRETRLSEAAAAAAPSLPWREGCGLLVGL